MRALVYHGPGQRVREEVPDPEITDEGDVIARVDVTTICGTDLHILAGDVPEVHPGRILGHEAVGTVVEIGDNVRRLALGDRVLVSCISGCGTCRFCREGRYGQCAEGGGWVLGRRIDGTQITTGLVDASSTPTLMRLVASGQLDVGRFVTHRFGMDDFERAYDIFGDAATNGALKVVLTREEDEDEDEEVEDE